MPASISEVATFQMSCFQELQELHSVPCKENIELMFSELEFQQQLKQFQQLLDLLTQFPSVSFL